MKLAPFLKLMTAAVAVALLSLTAVSPADAHQAVNPKILKMVRKAPAGTPSCYGTDGKPTAACIEKGRRLFEAETFGGNGRTCASCHPANNHFTLDVPFIQTLPKSDKLFVNEQVAALKELETPLLRKYGLICENLDGFADDATGQSCVLRSTIATEGLRFTTDPDIGGFDAQPSGPAPFTPARPVVPLKGALGWGGDGSPGEGTLRNFAIGAVVQHFPKTLQRTPGIDFVLPTEDELDAMEAFQLTLGRQAEMNLSPDPFAANGRFNCKAYKGTNGAACTTAAEFELKSMSQLRLWRSQQNKIQGTLLTFNDPMVERGQILFFGGFPSRPGANNAATDIRSCSGCHIQAGAGSAAAPNSPRAGNRPRATGASDHPNSPLCLPEAQGLIFNADGGFGAGEAGFPTAAGAVQPCNPSVGTTFPPIESCFKTFDAATNPPLSNPNITATTIKADVGKRFSMSRRDLCPDSDVNDDPVYFTGTSFFSTPSVIEAASTIPLFHNDIVATVEEAVSFYATDIFNNSVSGAGNRMVLDNAVDSEGHPLDISNDVGAFLRAINALNNLIIASTYIDVAIASLDNKDEKVRNAKLAEVNVRDVVAVLTVGGPNTDNYLGGPSNLFGTSVVSQFTYKKGELLLFGMPGQGYPSIKLADLKSAHNQIAAACRSMLTPDAQSYCPPAMP